MALRAEEDVFEGDDPTQIAQSLKRSAEHSHRRKSEPYQSAMSMLTFDINRAGKNLSKKKQKVLDKAKEELRKAFGRGGLIGTQLSVPRSTSCAKRSRS